MHFPENQFCTDNGAMIAMSAYLKNKKSFSVNDNLVEQTIETILSSATTSKIGDGKIFVLDIQEAIRVRTGEKGPEAL